MNMAVLVDLTKCIGCHSCSVACKLWNGLSFKKKPPRGNAKPGDLDDRNWTVIQKKTVTATDSGKQFQNLYCLKLL